jgi:hypothetical protein
MLWTDPKVTLYGRTMLKLKKFGLLSRQKYCNGVAPTSTARSSRRGRGIYFTGASLFLLQASLILTPSRAVDLTYNIAP